MRYIVFIVFTSVNQCFKVSLQTLEPSKGIMKAVHPYIDCQYTGFSLLKTRACDSRIPRHEIHMLQTCEKSHATHQVGMWWCAMIIPFRTPKFSFFLTTRCTNYQSIEIKTGHKVILKIVPSRKIRAKMFLTVVLRFHKVRGDLNVFRMFSQMKYCFQYADLYNLT